MSSRSAGAGLRPSRAGSVATHVVLSAGAVIMVAPFAWELLTSFKSLGESMQIPISIWPREWRLTSYREVFDAVPLGHMFVNSVINTVARTLAQLVFCSMAAYAFARMKFRGRSVIFGLLLSVLMVPGQLLLIPQYQILSSLGWLNTVQALFIPGMFSAFGTFLLRQFFLSLPSELEEAAHLDGAGPLRTYWSVMLPLSKPGLVALSIFTVQWSWNDLLWPLVVNNDPSKMPLSVGLTILQGQHTSNYPDLMAASLIATVPLIVAFVLFQRQFVEGLALSGRKG